MTCTAIKDNLIKLIVFCLFTSTLFAQTMHIEVIPAQHQQAENLIEPLKTILEPGATIKAFQHQLIIKTTATNLEEIRLLLEELDKPAKSLLIHVRQGNSANRTGYKVAASGEIYISDSSRVIINKSGDPTVKVKSYNTHSSDTGTINVTATEGHPAFITTGQQMPFLSSVTTDLYGNTYGGIQYKDVTRGFYATPFVRGDDNLVIEISSQNNKLSRKGGAAIDTQQVSTTVRGRLNEWLPLGGVNQTTNKEGSGILSRKYKTQSSNMNWEIMVELAN